MPEIAEQLARLQAAGFSVETFERYPNAVGALRDGAIALLQATPEGLVLIGLPGWRMGEVMGVLVRSGGRQVFRYKDQETIATDEKLATLRRFRSDLETALSGKQ